MKYEEVAHTFSEGLKNRLMEYFKNEYGVEMSSEEANLFLGSLARVYDALTKKGPLLPSV